MEKYRGIRNLILISFGIWILTFKALPWITEVSPAASELAAYIDESGIETGMFYYTGVEAAARAEANARGAIFYTENQN